MIKQVLLLNSDLAKNRGDRAIAEGNIALIKKYLPSAHITGISQEAKRDTQWYGIDFISMDFQSLNPVDFVRILRAAKQQDLIMWGGGEILKDYTNKAALWYWAFKIFAISLVNKNIVGAYQGIGPTKANSSRRIIAKTVNRCRGFIVRDVESYEKLVDWGADQTKIVHSSDPAVLPIPQKIDAKLKKKLKADYDINDAFLKEFVCIGPRDWFHYTPGGIIPFKYRQRINRMFGNTEQQDSDTHKLYIENLEKTVDYIANKLGKNILFVPMHMGESDIALSKKLSGICKDASRAKVVSKDTLSPTELRSLVGTASIMVGFRLHSNIIGVSAGTPSLNIYYVDKGRVFFDQIKQSTFAIPIESLLEDDYLQLLQDKFSELLKNKVTIEKEIAAQTKILRNSVNQAFETVVLGDKTK